MPVNINPKNTAVQYVLSLLAKREYSEYELKLKLQQKVYSEEEIDRTLTYVKQKKWQSDERFCTEFIRYRSQQGYGPLRLRQELRLRGVTDSLIAEKLATSEIDWFELASYIFKKKKPVVWDMKAKQKMWRYLLNHGFEYEHFREWLNIKDE